MKKRIASALFLLALSLAFLSAFFMGGPAVVPGSGIALAGDCPVHLVCFENPLMCCFVDCHGRIIGQCITG